jgi:hypothetical protein
LARSRPRDPQPGRVHDPGVKSDHLQTRRHFFRECATGIGKIGLASLLARDAFGASSAKTHFPAKVDHVIYLFMAGGPSQLELFDHKPSLNKWHDKPTPKEFLDGKRFAFMDTFAKETPKLLGCDRKFAQYGKSGRRSANYCRTWPRSRTI